MLATSLSPWPPIAKTPLPAAMFRPGDDQFRPGRLWPGANQDWVRIADVLRDDAVVDYFTAQLSRGATAFAYRCRSRAWLRQNELDKAQADVREALRLDARNPSAYFAAAKIAAAQERGNDDRPSNQFAGRGLTKGLYTVSGCGAGSRGR